MGRRDALPVRAAGPLRRGARAAEGGRACSIPASAPAPTSPPNRVAPRRTGPDGAALSGHLPRPGRPGPRRGPHAWRLDVAKAMARAGPLDWMDGDDRGRRPSPRASATSSSPARTRRPPIISPSRSTMPTQGVTDVVRGRDLFASTHVHRLLQALLDLPTPLYHHHDLLTDADGQPARQAPRCADARRPARRRRRSRRPGRGAAAGRIAGWIFADGGVRGPRHEVDPHHPDRARRRRHPVRADQGRGRHGAGQGHYRPALAGADAEAHACSRRSRSCSPSPCCWSRAAAEAPALVRLNKIYTRTGDAGETGLVDGSRASKADPRFAAIGDVDEANSAIGVALLAVDGRRGARDARPHPERIVRSRRRSRHARTAIEGALRIQPDQIARLEREIDAMNEDLEPLRSFILPGGGGGSAAAPSRPGGGAAGRAGGGGGCGGRSIRSRSTISTACRTICSCLRVGWRVRGAATSSGSRARHAAADMRSPFVLGAGRAGGRRWRHRSGRTTGESLAARYAAVRAAQPRHRRAAVRRRRHASSRCRTPRRPNGISPTRPGSSRPSCCATICPAIAPMTRATPICSTPIMRARASGIRARDAGMIARPSLDEVRAWRAAVDEALLGAIGRSAGAT